MDIVAAILCHDDRKLEEDVTFVEEFRDLKMERWQTHVEKRNMRR